MKIIDLKKNINESIYKQILEINEIDENCTLLREAIVRDETQYEDVMIEFTKWIDEIYKNDMTMWYFKQIQNEYIFDRANY